MIVLSEQAPVEDEEPDSVSKAQKTADKAADSNVVVVQDVDQLQVCSSLFSCS